MTTRKTIGKLEEKKFISEEMEVQWEIPDFLSMPNAYYNSASNFKFLNMNWYLTIDPFAGNFSAFIDLHLQIDDADDVESPYDIICIFGIKKNNGSLTGIKSFYHTFCRNSKKVLVENFYLRNNLKICESKIMPSNNLTIICKLLLLSDSLTFTELNTLAEDIKHLYSNEELCDITLQIKGKEFKAHKVILAARSPVFAAMFKHETAEKQTGIVNIADCNPESFQHFLEYLYCGKLEHISSHNARHLYEIADKYNVLKLKLFCIKYMCENFTKENFYDVVILAELYEETSLFAAAQNFFNRNLKEIFISDEWNAFMKKELNLANKLLTEMASKVKVAD